jgi:hypothetical protein
MDLSNIGIAPPVTAVSIIAWAIAVLAIGAAFAIKPVLKWRKASLVGSGLLVICALLVVAMGITFGVGHSLQLERQADNEAFHEKLEADYGITTGSSLSEVERAADWHRTIVLTDSTGTFEARAHTEGSMLTFFRVDNGRPVVPRS